MKNIRKILQIAVCLFAGIYLIMMFALDTTKAKEYMADIVSQQLTKQLQSKVEIKEVSLRLFNAVELHKVKLYDRNNNLLLNSELIYGKVKLKHLVEKKIFVQNIAILDTYINIYKESEKSAPNFQFVIDAFTPKERHNTKINLVINSFLLRRCKFTYNSLYIPKTSSGIFSIHHINLDNIEANLAVKALTNDSLNVRVRQLCFHEKSDFTIKNLRLHLIANRQHAELQDINLQLNNSHFTQKKLSADYNGKDWNTLKESLTLKGRLSDILISTLDISPFVPKFNDFNEQIRVFTNITINKHQAFLDNTRLYSNDKTVDFGGNILYNFVNKKKKLTIQTHYLYINQSIIENIYLKILKRPIPSTISALFPLSYNGNITGTIIDKAETSWLKRTDFYTSGIITTTCGSLNTNIELQKQTANISISSIDFKPFLLYKNKYVPTLLNFNIKGSTKFDISTDEKGKSLITPSSCLAELSIQDAIINGKRITNFYSKLSLDSNKKAGLQFISDDPNVRIHADFSAALDKKEPFSDLPHDITLQLDIQSLTLLPLQLIKRYGDSEISMQVYGGIKDLNLKNLEGNINVHNFTLNTKKSESENAANSSSIYVKKLSLTSLPTENGNHIVMRSDFADLDYSGAIHPQQLKKIGEHIYSSIRRGTYIDENSEFTEISTQTKEQKTTRQKENYTTNLAFAIRNTDVINLLAGTNIRQDGIIMGTGTINEDASNAYISLFAPSLSLGKLSIHDFSVYAHKNGDAFNLLAKIGKKTKNSDLIAEMTAINNKGKILTDIEWDETKNHKFYGKISAESILDVPSSTMTDSSQSFNIFTEFLPTTLCIGDSIWQFAHSKINYSKKCVAIEGFGIHNRTQSLFVNGIYDRSRQDTITIDLNNIDLDYALAFARLDVVEFSGHATGKAYVTQRFDGTPWANAHVFVPDFQFNHTKFGQADVTLGWDHDARDILITGNIVEPGIGYTKVNGYVDPVNRDLDLNTESKNTQLGFINKYTEGIFSNISGRATGNCRIYGGFRSIEFSGHETAECQATIPVTGVTYKISNADVDIYPDAFDIKYADIKDMYNGEGTAYGKLTHEHIKNMCYDFYLDGKNLRLYDKPRELDMPFFATANGTGNVHIFGSPGKMNADIRIATVPGSEMTYIIDSPDADVSQLVTFNEMDSKATFPSSIPAQNNPIPTETESTTLHPETPNTDINLFFEVDVDKNSCLHLITDDKSGDVITVYGEGPIQATYHNKSGFQMYGIYNIDRGTYGLNIPTLAQRKKFDILSGGQVSFSGDPMTAEVNVKAQYVVNSASLADLNIGTGFANNTTRVNCLVNILGEVGNMQFELDFELPNCSDDEQQMVRSLIASEEDRTMQVLYLLGVGRFYAYNYDTNEQKQSQSILMMNSLLSSTLSSQLNNIISDAIGTSNWTFGTNISTGQLGWNDMEVEGLISSRLLNNRLLLNGNFGYSDRQAATTNFVGDFDMQYLITPKGTVSIRAYSETNDRYFTKSTLTTQGVGLQLRRDFSRLKSLFNRKKTKK